MSDTSAFVAILLEKGVEKKRAEIISNVAYILYNKKSSTACILEPTKWYHNQKFERENLKNMEKSEKDATQYYHKLNEIEFDYNSFMSKNCPELNS
jgi:hypothetical protein